MIADAAMAFSHDWRNHSVRPRRTRSASRLAAISSKVVGVLYGIVTHLRRQRTQRPVGFLRGFGNGDVEVFEDERGEAELGDAGEARREHGIENGCGSGVADAAQEAQVVVRAVNDEFLSIERAKERLRGRARRGDRSADHGRGH